MNVAKKELVINIISLTLIIIVTLIAQRIPLEDYLSEYPLPRTLRWYVPWRIAVVNFIIWLFSLVLYLCDIHEISSMLFISGVVFMIAHYYTIITVLRSGYKVILGPLVFYTGYYGNTLDVHVDIGQIVFIIITIILIYEYKLKKST